MNVANGRLRRQSNTSSVQLTNLTARLADGSRKPAPFALKPASDPSSVTNARRTSRPACLSLRGVVAVLSGQDAPLKSHMHALISAMGGSFARDLDPRTVTHLVVDGPSGNKYDYWRQHMRLSSEWAVDCHVVTSGWVEACDREGRRVGEEEWGLGSENAKRRRRPEVPVESRQRLSEPEISCRERLPEELRQCSPLEVCEALIEEDSTDRKLFSGRCFILVGFEGEILKLQRKQEEERQNGKNVPGRKGLSGGTKRDSSSNLLEVEATRLDSSVSGRNLGNEDGDFVPHFGPRYHPGSLKNSLATLLRRAGGTILHRPNEYVDVVLVNDGITTEMYEDVKEFCACHPRGPLGATLDWSLACLHEGKWIDPAFPEEPRQQVQYQQHQDLGLGDNGGFDYYEGDETNQTDAAVLGVKEESNIFSSETARRANVGRTRKRPGPVSVEPNGPRRESVKVKRETDAASRRGSKGRPTQAPASVRPGGSGDLFRGDVFAVVRLSSLEDGTYNFDRSEMETTITRHGGLLLDASLLRAVERDGRRRLKDPASSDGQRRRRYFVVATREFRVDMATSASHPLLSSLSKLVEVETVSPVWVRACTEENQPFDPADCPGLFRPPRWPVRLLPADTSDRSKRLVVSVTGFVDSTRWAVKHALLLVGAEFTDTLTRRNTHLVAKEDAVTGGEGSRSQKVVKADEWGIKIVGVEWLHRVMRHGRDGADDDLVGENGSAIATIGEVGVKAEAAAPKPAKSAAGPERKAAREADDILAPPGDALEAKHATVESEADGRGDRATTTEPGPKRARVSLFQSVMSSSSQACPSGRKGRPPPRANEAAVRPAEDCAETETGASAEGGTVRDRPTGSEPNETLEGARADREAATSPSSAQNEDSNSSWSSSQRRGKRDRSPRRPPPPHSSTVEKALPQASPLRPADDRRRSPADVPGPTTSSSSSLTPGPGSSPGRRLQFALDVLGGPPPPAGASARRKTSRRRGKRDRGRSPGPSQSSADPRGEDPDSPPSSAGGGSPCAEQETQATLGTVNVGAYAAGLGFARRTARAGRGGGVAGRDRLIGGQMVPGSQVDEAEDNGESQVVWFAGGR